MTEFFDAARVQGKRRMKLFCVQTRTGEREWFDDGDHARAAARCNNNARVVEYIVPFSKLDFVQFLNTVAT